MRQGRKQTTYDVDHKTLSKKKASLFIFIDQRGGVVVRASVSRSVNLRFIPQVESYQKTFKNGIHSFPTWRSAHRDSVENKPASLLVFLGKVFNRMPPSSCGRQVAGPSSLTKDMQTRHELIRININKHGIVKKKKASL